MRTIVVDDEPIMLKSFKRLSAGIDAINIVGDFLYPEEAIEFAGNEQVDLAILDIAMPGMNGIELANKLRDIRPDMRIVFISAYEEYLSEAEQLNADGYIIKPYHREDIEKMVEAL